MIIRKALVAQRFNEANAQLRSMTVEARASFGPHLARELEQTTQALTEDIKAQVTYLGELKHDC